MPAPEHWSTSAGDLAQATLHIPADAQRERRFEIGIAMTVALPADGGSGWHQLTVLANGSQQWSRRVATHNPGAFDGLDYRFSRVVPVGQALKVQAHSGGQGVRRRSLRIEADEI